MSWGSREQLRMLPSGVYAVKALYTHCRSLAWLVQTRGHAATNGLRMLFYHRVTPDRDPLGVRPERFRQQMECLAEAGWRVVDVAQAGDLLRRGEPLDRVASISFDEGYLDVFEHAMPVLSEFGFKATVFLVTGALDGDVTFGWYKKMPPLISWEDVTRLDGSSPLVFEAHTITHPNLLAVDDEQAEREIAGSKTALEGRLGRAVEAFSYPAGLFGARERRLVERAGYRVAVASEPGLNDAGADLFALRRNQIDYGDRLLSFRAKLGGGHDTPLPFRGLHRRVRYGAPSRTV